jgi:dUTPase
MDPFFRLISGRIERATQDSAAFDLFYDGPPTLVGDKAILLATGVSSIFSPGFVAIMKERSGLGLKGLEVKAGVIDADYRGMWGVVARFPVRFDVIWNDDGTFKGAMVDPTWRPFVVNPGDKIAQFLLVETAKLEILTEPGTILKIGQEVRGTRGFGSSDRSKAG